MLKTEAVGQVPREMLKTETEAVGQVPREMLKTEAVGRGFQHLPRDLANVDAWKTMFDPYIVIFNRNLDGLDRQ